MQKTYIKAQQLLDDSFRLGSMVLRDDFRPDYILGVLRGGAPVAMVVHEFLDFHGVRSDYIGIRVLSYSGIDQQSEVVKVDGLDYVVQKIKTARSLLIVDDIFDSGRTMQELMKYLGNLISTKQNLSIRIATVYFRSPRNKISVQPDYFVHRTDKWLVFPHELQGLTDKEIEANKPLALF